MSNRSSRSGGRSAMDEVAYQTPIKRPQPVIDHSLKIGPLSQSGNVTKGNGSSPIIELDKPLRSGRLTNGQLDGNCQKERGEYDDLCNRITQMERTMRWWSDCAESWREKLSYMTFERDHLKDENKALRERLAERVASSPGQGFKAPDQRSSHQSQQPMQPLDFILQNLLCELAEVDVGRELRTSKSTQTEAATDVGVMINENLTGQLSSYSGRSSSIKSSRSQSSAGELNLAEDAEVNALKIELQEERNSKAVLELKVAELRRKVETWQQQVSKAEDREQSHIVERVKSEQEIQALTKQCEDLRKQVGELLREKRQSLRTTSSSSTPDLETRELMDLKAENSRLKKTLQDQLTELGHMIRRIEHYESDTAHLRTKINLLQQEISLAQRQSEDDRAEAEKVRAINDALRQQLDRQLQPITQRQTKSSK